MKYTLLLPLAVGGLLLATGCSSGKSTTQTTTTTTAESSTAPVASPSAPAMKASAAPAIASDGAKVFTDNCSSCHGAKGQGMPGAFPPLAHNPVVIGDVTHVIHIVEYGLQGKIQVLGASYNGVMPAWKSQLSDAQIASAVSYIRSAWGNSASAVSAADVAGVKI